MGRLCIQRNAAPSRRAREEVLLDGRERLVELDDMTDRIARRHHRTRRGPPADAGDGGGDARDLPALRMLDDGEVLLEPAACPLGKLGEPRLRGYRLELDEHRA